MFHIFTQREELRRHNKELQKEVKELKNELRDYKEALKENQARLSVVEKWEEDLPTDSEKRQQYLADITVHYSNVMKGQLNRMIEEQKDALSKIDVSDEFSRIYRSNINCLLLIKGFYERCESEYMGTLHEKRSDDDISSLRESIYA